VSGCSTPTGKFYPTHASLQSHEDTRAFVNTYKYVQNEVGNPAFRMADGAREITKAGEEVKN
jgi:hypothetical protein